MTDQPPNQDPGAGKPESEDMTRRMSEAMLQGKPPQDSLIGTSVDQYSIKRVIGEGGMGVVYEALQQSPRRTVALKMIKRGVTSKSAMRRFEYEAQTLGRLRHDGIAQIYQAGTWDDGTGGRPWFAMEYIQGAKTLTQYCKDKKLGTRERLVIFSKVCAAVQHGHAKGIIHRDLKPGNILVTSSGAPKVIDFGVARSTDSDLAVTTLQTDVGALIGTLQYMSPEQCDADPNDIDIRSDVYALGVVFYELLTKSLPYDVTNQAIHEAARIVREESPTRPSTIDRVLRGDIETVCLKALEKDRDRRYQSAVEMRQDIDRYLAGDPVTARRASLAYQLRLLYRRHRLAFVLSSLLLVVLIGGVLALSWLATLQAQSLRESNRQAARAQFIVDGVTAMLSPPPQFPDILPPDESWLQGPNVVWPRDIRLEVVIDQSATVLTDVMQVVQTDEDAQGAAYMALALGHSYKSIGALDKAQEQVDSALALLRAWYPTDHPNLYDAHMISMELEFAQRNIEQGMAVGKQILRHQSDALGRYNPNTLGTAWSVANHLATVGSTDAASELLAEHLRGITCEQMVASQPAIDAVVLLATIPTQEPPKEVIELLERATPPNTTGLRDEQIEVVQDIAWYLGFEAGHLEVALHALRRLDAEFLDDDPNEHFCRRNRIFRAKALFELGQYEDASELFEQQVELDRRDPGVSEEEKEEQRSNLIKTKEQQKQHDTLP